MTREELRRAVEDTAREALRWEGPLPAGDLAQELDSLQRLTLAVAIEDRFRICLDASSESSIASLEDLVSVVSDGLADDSA